MTKQSHIKRSGVVSLVAVLGIVLTGCGKQPPECTSAEMAKTIKGVVAERVINDYTVGKVPYSKEGAAILKKYLEDLTIKFSGVVEKGYNKDTKARACEGDLTFTAPTGLKVDLSMGYQVQLTSDGKDFVINYPKSTIASAATETGFDAWKYAMKSRDLLGDWGGTLSCEPLVLSPEKTVPQVLAFATFEAVNERSNFRGKNIQELQGSIDPFHDTVSIEGRNSSLTVALEGRLEEKKALLKGDRNSYEWRANDGKTLSQNCTLTLTKGQTKPQ